MNNISNNKEEEEKEMSNLKQVVSKIINMEH